jgi:hypothetical protein
MGNNNNSIYREFLREHNIDTQKLKKWNDKQKSRLQKLIDGDKINDHMTHITFDKMFDKFTSIYIEWQNDAAILFWKNYNINDMKVIRRQMTGLCFMHAPVVLQYYMYCIYNKENSHLKMIDVAKYIKTYWHGEKLCDYLERDSGGRSIDFLKEITKKECVIEDRFIIPNKNNKFYKSKCENIMNTLKIKPALVSEFKVDKKFKKEGVRFIGTVDDNEIVGLHAMVLIGARKHNDEYYFLLQNWWHNRYFIEVSGEYMHSAECTIYFLENNISEIPSEFPVVSSLYAETTMDACETVHEMVLSI